MNHSKTMLSLTWFSKTENANGKPVVVAHCVEYDLCVQGSSFEQVGERIDKLMAGHVMISKELGKVPFAGLPAGRLMQAVHVPGGSVRDSGGPQRKMRSAAKRFRKICGYYSLSQRRTIETMIYARDIAGIG